MHQHTNRLIRETSPYLLQHAHNPVDWYPWGQEAFQAARDQNKPIFLSIGYSTCYWCHVMERQCFENETIATEMNRRFINIKVDREERPDVDQLYMTAIQILTHQGGWPMSVFLTPDLRPFYGGTYFPPTDQHGRPGFPTLLRAIEDAYRSRPHDVEQTARQLVDILGQLAEPQPAESPLTLDQSFINALVERSVSDYDSNLGGFGSAPKFPRQTLLELLLAWSQTDPHDNRRQEIRRMVLHTLDAMSRGGIRDHLGGGFHRYSTDAQWLVPHFEIMLYDNAMLAWLYTEAHRLTAQPNYARVARGIIDFVLREMTSPQGAFYTAFDAEVDAKEGDSYLWTADQINALLPHDDAKLFNRVYGLDLGPNFTDPHYGNDQPDQNILYLPQPIESAARELGLDPAQLESRLEPMRQTLYHARLQRKQPALDTKILTSWNALMIRALAHAGRVLAEPRYLQAATRAAEFLLQHHRTPDGGLYRTSRDGRPGNPGFLDDYAFLLQALLDLNQTQHTPALTDSLIHRFADEKAGGFYFTDKTASDLILRQKIGNDSPLPSGNAIAALVLTELRSAETPSVSPEAPEVACGFAKDKTLDSQHPLAQSTLALFAPQLDANAESMSSMLLAALNYVRRHGPVLVVPPAQPLPTDRPLTPQQTAAGIVTLRGVWTDPTHLNIHLSILPPFHIHAHSTRPGLLPTELSVTGEGIAVESIDYPPGKERHFPFSPEPLRVYEGEVILVVRLKNPPAWGNTLHLNLHYQACDESACLPPVTKSADVSVP